MASPTNDCRSAGESPRFGGIRPRMIHSFPSGDDLVPCVLFGGKLSVFSAADPERRRRLGRLPDQNCCSRTGEICYLISTGSRYLAGEGGGYIYLGKCFVKARIYPREFGLNLSDPRGQDHLKAKPHRPLASRKLRWHVHAEWLPPQRWRRQVRRHQANHPSSKRRDSPQRSPQQ